MLNKESAKKVRAVIDRLDRHGETKAFPDNPNIPDFRPTSIPAAEGSCLSKWVASEKAGSAIEIGLAYGYSTLHIGEGLLLGGSADLKHTIIDPYQTQSDKYANVGLDTLAKAGLGDMVEFFGEGSEVVLPRLLSQGRIFDFAFIDGNHLFDHVFIDLSYLGKLVKQGGIIFLDDYDKPAIRKAASFFVKNLEWTIEEHGQDDKSNREWLVMRTAAKGDERQWFSFVDF